MPSTINVSLSLIPIQKRVRCVYERATVSRRFGLGPRFKNRTWTYERLAASFIPWYAWNMNRFIDYLNIFDTKTMFYRISVLKCGCSSFSLLIFRRNFLLWYFMNNGLKWFVSFLYVIAWNNDFFMLIRFWYSVFLFSIFLFLFFIFFHAFFYFPFPFVLFLLLFF